MTHVVTIPLGFKYVFNCSTPKDYFNFISKYPKGQLIRALSIINAKSQIYVSDLFGERNKRAHTDFLKQFELRSEIHSHILNLLSKKNDTPLAICCRESTLYGIEEVLNSDIEDKLEEDDYLQNLEFRHNIFCYLLCINDTYFGSNLAENFDLEDLNASLLPANSCMEFNIYRCLLKGYKLALFLSNHEVIKNHYNDFISSKYKTNIDNFIAFFIKYSNSSGFIRVTERSTDSMFFNELSVSEFSNDNICSLKCLKLSPVYKVSENEFIIMDLHFFIGKFYFQFINDFWFNFIKPKKLMAVKVYYSIFGDFFENYCSDILNNVFSNLRYPRPKALDELKFGKKTTEFTDFYARQNKNVLLGEFKVGNINDKDRFSGSVDGLYSRSGGKKEFFKCLYQLKKAIQQLDVLKLEFDNSISLERKLTIYPICIFNDNSFKLLSMKIAFSEQWNKIISEIQTHHEVKSLIILQIDELEELKRLKTDKEKKEIWKILNRFCQTKNGFRTFEFRTIYNFDLESDLNVELELQSFLDNYK